MTTARLDMCGISLCPMAIDYALKLLQESGAVEIVHLGGNVRSMLFTDADQLEIARWAIAASYSNESILAS